MIAKRKLSVADFLAMGELRLFGPDERVELLDGEVYTVSPPSPEHAGMVNRLVKLLAQAYGERCVISVQNPLILDDFRLTEPDVALLKPDPSFYTASHPAAQDALLVIEVSRSSLQYGRTEKLPRYAEAGVREVWILDVDARQLGVYLEPVHGSYRQRTLYYPGETVAPSAFVGSEGAEGEGIVPLPQP